MWAGIKTDDEKYSDEQKISRHIVRQISIAGFKPPRYLLSQYCALCIPTNTELS